MIPQLIALFDASVNVPVATRYGLATLGENGPLMHDGGAQHTPIAVDKTAPWSYWRVGNIQSSPYDIMTCDPGSLQKVTFRLVLLLPNDCGHQSILIAAGQGVARAMPAAKELLGAIRVKVVGQRSSVEGVNSQERIANVPLQWSLIALDVDVEILGTADCLEGCEDAPSALCALIATSTNTEVVECLGDRVNEICDSTPCEVTVNGTPSDTPTITVTQDGAPVGTLNPATGNVDVPPCPPCPPGEAYPVDTDGTPVGPAVPVASGASVPVTAPDGSVMTSDGLVEVMSIKSGEIKPLPKSKILYTNTAGSSVFTALYDNKFDGDLYPATTIPRRELLNMSGDPVSSPATYVALDHLIDDTLPKAPDSATTVNSTPFANVRSGGALNIPVKDTDGVLRGSKVGSEWIVPASPLKFTFPIRDQYASWLVTADEAGPYNAWTDDGASGTFTYRLGGTGSYAAPSGTVTLVAGVLIEVMRTVTTAQGWQRWQRS